MKSSDEFAEIIQIDDVYSVYITPLSRWNEWLHKKKYHIDIIGKNQSYKGYMDRVSLNDIHNTIFDNGIIVTTLNTTKQHMEGRFSKARITIYPKGEYSVAHIFFPEAEYIEKQIKKVIGESHVCYEHYILLAKLNEIDPALCKKTIEKDPNMSVCPECHVENFNHVEHCHLGEDIESWAIEYQKGLAKCGGQ